MAKKALVLVNLGTPDKAGKKEVRNYLSEFLNDTRVIDIPWLARKILVNLIIIPFRAGRSAKLYKRLWTEKGSPLLIYLNNLTLKLQERSRYTVLSAMRYGRPSLRELLRGIRDDGYDEIIIFPLFPQYASSTTGSVFELIFEELRAWEVIPALRFAGQYYDHPEFIGAFAKQISRYDPGRYDHMVFSYHGLPFRHIRKVHPGKDCQNCECEKQMPYFGKLCYKAACYETTRLLISKLDIPKSKISVGFQSRLSKNWLAPFTDELIAGLAAKGSKKILIAAPSFVADCLETVVELEYEYGKLFKDNGGEELTLVKSLNDSDDWADAIMKIAGHQ